MRRRARGRFLGLVVRGRTFEKGDILRAGNGRRMLRRGEYWAGMEATLSLKLRRYFLVTTFLHSAAHPSHKKNSVIQILFILHAMYR